MIDYLKIIIFNRELAEVLFKHPLLKNYSFNQSFKNNLNKEVEGINQSTYIKEYKEILFCFFTKNNQFTKLEILLKPHYYFNGNLHNANDFTVLNCINALTEIKNTFNLPVRDLLILNIEFGINGISPIDCKNLITYSIYHDKNEFINSSDSLRYSKISFKYNKNGRANNYKKIKFYAKGVQFPEYCDPNTFRFEVKSKRRTYINQLGIYTYEDLLKTETYRILAKNLLKEWNKVLILDFSNKMQNLNSREVKLLKDHLQTLSWYNAIQGSKNTFNNHKKSYSKLLDKTYNNIHSIIENIIGNKLSDLLKGCAILTPPIKSKGCAILNNNIIENGTTKQKRICPITGIELTHEKDGSKYIKTTTLKYLHNYHQTKFIELCSILLSNTKGKQPKYEKNIFTRLAKQVRNRYYNPIIIKQSGYNQMNYPNQLELFN